MFRERLRAGAPTASAWLWQASPDHVEPATDHRGAMMDAERWVLRFVVIFVGGGIVLWTIIIILIVRAC